MHKNALFLAVFLMLSLPAAADCSPEVGARLFANKCGICHVADKDAGHAVGPNLFGVVGRPVGRAAGFEYSNAMAAESANWTTARMDHFLTSPQKAIPGTSMPFQGLRSERERAQVICYLETLK